MINLFETVSAKTFLLVMVSLVIGFVGGTGYTFFLLDNSDDQGKAQGESGTVVTVPSSFDVSIEGRPFLGNPNAPVTVIELVDYECPFCERHHRQVLQELLSEYGDSIHYVTLNFPLTSIHPLAFKVSEAAECAHDQGRYWDYRDSIFDSSGPLDSKMLLNLAELIGLDDSKFTECIMSGSKGELVRRDIADGLRHGARGTPSFFINGKLITGARPLDIFKEVIDAELAKLSN